MVVASLVWPGDLPCPSHKSGDSHLSIKNKVIVGGITGSTKARYEDKMLKPLGKLDLKEGDEVEITVPGSLTKKLYGLVKCWEGAEEALDGYDSNIHWR